MERLFKKEYGREWKLSKDFRDCVKKVKTSPREVIEKIKTNMRWLICLNNETRNDKEKWDTMI